MSSERSLFEDRTESTATLEGTLERVVYSNPENAWSVVRLDVDDRTPPVTAVGKLFGVQPGETLKLRGRWVEDRRFGRQFEVDSFTTVTPSTETGIQKYLASGLVEGIGPVMAARLVDRFGLDTLDVIDRQPERLEEVEGIGRVRRRRIEEAWEKQRDIRDVMVFLQSHGVSTNFAVKIFDRYESEAVRVVRDDPYRLATDIRGIGFATADDIADRLGVARDSLERAGAGLLHVLREAAGQGHLYLGADELLDRGEELLDIERPRLEEALRRLVDDRAVIVDSSDETETAVYLRNLYLTERSLALRLGRLLAVPGVPLDVDIEKAWAWYERRHGITLAPEQRQAIATAITAKATLITGGPGTGKTTIIRAIVEIAGAKRQRIVLAAPTGRAAKRLSEATGHEAATIHRLLEFAPATMSFERNENRPLPADLVIVDEFSMVDVTLARHLVLAVPPNSRLVMVGDADQLPPVGPGRVLSDLIESGRLETVRLRRIFRQAKRSLIVRNAHRIVSGRPPRLPAEDDPSDFFFIERRQPEAALETVRHLVAERIPARFGFDPLDDVQVLTPMRRGVLGTEHLNRQLQELLNPDGASLGRGDLTLGDKVMQVRNDYELEVFNGDVGIVAAAGGEDGGAVVRFDERRVRYRDRDLDQLELAYACSIHKSQGSEYPCVVLILHDQHHVMLQRNLLYTGVTRGRRLVVLIGTRRAVTRAVDNESPQHRNSRLADRLRRATETNS